MANWYGVGMLFVSPAFNALTSFRLEGYEPKIIIKLPSTADKVLAHDVTVVNVVALMLTYITLSDLMASLLFGSRKTARSEINTTLRINIGKVTMEKLSHMSNHVPPIRTEFLAVAIFPSSRGVCCVGWAPLAISGGNPDGEGYANGS